MDTEESMKKVAGEVFKLGRFKSDKIQVKDVDAFVAENAEAFATAGYGKQGNYQGKQRRRSHSESDVQEKNPMRDGKRMRCHFCDSEYHFKPKCEKYKAWTGAYILTYLARFHPGRFCLRM